MARPVLLLIILLLPTQLGCIWDRDTLASPTPPKPPHSTHKKSSLQEFCGLCNFSSFPHSRLFAVPISTPPRYLITED